MHDESDRPLFPDMIVPSVPPDRIDVSDDPPCATCGWRRSMHAMSRSCQHFTPPSPVDDQCAH